MGIKWTIGAYVIGILLYYSVVTIIGADFETIKYALMIIIVATQFFALMMVILFYPLKKFGYSSLPCRAHNNFVIKQLLESKDGFDAFARHLSKEFCLENLLFFVETQQWLLYLTRMSSYRDCINYDDDLIHIRLHATCPKSQIW